MHHVVRVDHCARPRFGEATHLTCVLTPSKVGAPPRNKVAIDGFPDAFVRTVEVLIGQSGGKAFFRAHTRTPATSTPSLIEKIPLCNGEQGPIFDEAGPSQQASFMEPGDGMVA